MLIITTKQPVLPFDSAVKDLFRIVPVFPRGAEVLSGGAICVTLSSDLSSRPNYLCVSNSFGALFKAARFSARLLTSLIF